MEEPQANGSGTGPTLEGTVQSWAEKELCVSVAKGVRGVRDVNDQLLVRYIAERPDHEIRAEIEARLANDVRVDDYGVTVGVDGVAVTLSGTVDNLASREAGEQDARNVIGVWRVRNHLKVRPATLPSDEELEKRVGRALREYEHEWTWKPDWELLEDVKDQLFWSPFVDEADVSVAVDNGVVTLTGQVDTWLEHADAAKQAWEAGAKDARKRLSVRFAYWGPLWPSRYARKPLDEPAPGE
jgi:osmotically-inducible protein OsmY